MYFKEPLKSDLVAALRSGEYDQTTGSLMIRSEPEFETRPSGFCCLGVACHLVDPSGFDDDVDSDFLYLGERDNEGLPKTFVDRWTIYTDVPDESVISLGQFTLNEQQAAAAKEMMPDIVCRFPWPSGKLSLSDLNDNGATFAQIADLIEAHC